MDLEKLKEFEKILEKFSRFISLHIQKFHPQKSGIDPDDVYQEVKIKIWKVLNNEKPIKNYASYIKKIVDSTLIDQIRKIRREDGVILYEKQKSITENKNQYARNESYSFHHKEILGRGVESLLESRRKVVKLFLLNMTIEEIAIFLNWSKDKTRNLLYRGLADLKKKLKEDGIDCDD